MLIAVVWGRVLVLRGLLDSFSTSSRQAAYLASNEKTWSTRESLFLKKAVEGEATVVGAEAVVKAAVLEGDLVKNSPIPEVFYDYCGALQ